MSGEDEHAPISNLEASGTLELATSSPGEGPSWPAGPHAERGLETLEGWSPPRYRPEATSPGIRGIESLLPEPPAEPPHSLLRRGRARYRAEATIGTDERVRVFETTSFPWRAICQLEIYSQDDELYIGTGFFIGPRTVATAGHCVYLPEMGGWAKRIVVSPARNGRDRPYSSVSTTRFHTVRGWSEKLQREHDYAALTLPEGEGLPELGALGYAVCSTPTLMGAQLNLAGYPSDKDEGTTLWWSARRSAAVSEAVVRYDADTAAGQSGAPVWRLDPRTHQRVAVGIHTNGARTGNSATRITPSVYRNLKRWCEVASESGEA